MADLEHLRRLLDLAALEHPFWGVLRDAEWMTDVFAPRESPGEVGYVVRVRCGPGVEYLETLQDFCLWARAGRVGSLTLGFVVVHDSDFAMGPVCASALIARLEHGTKAKAAG